MKQKYLPPLIKFCRIKTMTYTTLPNGPYFASFHYNNFGDLDSVVYPPNPDLANLYFRYDNHHRLRDYIYGFPGGDISITGEIPLFRGVLDYTTAKIEYDCK